MPRNSFVERHEMNWCCVSEEWKCTVAPELETSMQVNKMNRTCCIREHASAFCVWTSDIPLFVW